MPGNTMDMTLDDVHFADRESGLRTWFEGIYPRPSKEEILRLGGAAFTYFHSIFNFSAEERAAAAFGRAAHVRRE